MNAVRDGMSSKIVDAIMIKSEFQIAILID